MKVGHETIRHIDSTNYETRLWPRGGSGANVLWHGDDNTGYLQMKARLHNFRCFMLSRGFKAEPIGPGGYCKNGESDQFDGIDPTGVVGSNQLENSILNESDFGIKSGILVVILLACFKILKNCTRRSFWIK